jgi:hypothetical protein
MKTCHIFVQWNLKSKKHLELITDFEGKPNLSITYDVYSQEIKKVIIDNTGYLVKDMRNELN